jgi:biotin carboxylase
VEHGITEMVAGVDLVAWMFELQVRLGESGGQGGRGRCAVQAAVLAPVLPALNEHPAIHPHSSPTHHLQGAPASELPADLASYQPAMVGHAIEVRICAEDPAHGYRPCTGLLGLVAWPKRTECRVDTWVETGVDVSGERGGGGVQWGRG